MYAGHHIGATCTRRGFSLFANANRANGKENGDTDS
jgi:hypothetical protein